MASTTNLAQGTQSAEYQFGPEVKAQRFSFKKFLCNSALSLFGLLFLAPLLWLIEASIDKHASRQIQVPALSFDNFLTVLQRDQLFGLLNSLVISTIATVVATVPAILAAYAFSRYKIPFKRTLLFTLLFLSGVPINILIVPVYELLQSINLLSAGPAAVFLGVTALPFELYIIKNAFDGVPLDMDESARLEGAGTLQILLRLVVPLAMPGIIAASLFGFVTAWGNFLIPLVIIQSADQQPSPVRIFGFMGANFVRYGDIAAFSLVYAGPVVVLYLFCARAFRSGFILGGAVR